MSKKTPKSDYRTRFIVSPQSTGRVGKSTVAQSILSWAEFAGVSWAALDADVVHQTLSSRWPDKVRLVQEAVTNPDAFKRVIDSVAAAPRPLMIADFPAQATPFILSTLEAQRSLEVLEAGGVRMTVPLFPADDETALMSLATILRTLGDRVDYIVVRNPARYKTTTFDGSAAQARLAELGAGELILPAMTASTLEDVNHASKAEGRFLPLRDAAPKMPFSSRLEAEYWLNQVYLQCEGLAHLLLPNPDLIVNRAERLKEAATAGKVDPFDPLNF